MVWNETSIEVMNEETFKRFVESYRCRICKTSLNLDNFGGLGDNHMIYCLDCKISGRYYLDAVHCALTLPRHPLTRLPPPPVPLANDYQ